MVERAIDAVENIFLIMVGVAVGASGPDEPFHAVCSHGGEVFGVTPEEAVTEVAEIQSHRYAGLAQVRDAFGVERALFGASK